MSRSVFCRKYKSDLPGLDAPPMPGPVGEDLFANISARAWSEWQDLQTMLINEHQLSMRDADARAYLSEQRDKFFANEDWEKPAGYVPPNKPLDL